MKKKNKITSSMGEGGGGVEQNFINLIRLLELYIIDIGVWLNVNVYYKSMCMMKID